MTPERWREIERLYLAALTRPANERAPWLEQVCGGDLALRGEVESLLDSAARAGDFLETPAAAEPLGHAIRQLEPAQLPGRFVGRTFGAYEVQTLIASGGMGEVYGARDTRLNRTVALKTLPGHLSHDAERHARFMREARIVSSLNHPHICTLHDIGVEDGIDYLVMEHIDGETLQRRLERGPLPLPVALECAVQIVDALDKAHRRGVIHRDLKPANIMLTRSGVKLLDFGLAVRSSPSGLNFDDDAADANGLTAAGAIMGTLQYISPEQLEGKPADARSDVFAFGSIAYEAITGTPAFPMTNRAQLVGAILRDEPRPLATVVPSAPLRLAQTIARCLAKDPDERWQSANDLLFELRSMSVAPATMPALAGPTPAGSRWVERAGWTAALGAGVVIALFAGRARALPTADSPAATPPVRYTLSPAEGTAFYAASGLPFALSPDGRHIVYVAVTGDGSAQLRLRSLLSQVEQPLSGTEGATTPFWSPDSQWIGFFAANSLKKIRVSSGLTQVIATNLQLRGGATWNGEDVIVFAAGPGGLSRVAAQGGPISAATTTREGSHFWPQFLADDKHFIYTAAVTGSIDLGSLGQDAPRTLMKFPVRISALAYVPGHVFYVQDATLFARPFDERRLAFTGPPVPVVTGVPVMGPGRAPFSVSAAGVLAYWTHPLGTPVALQWFDRNGRATAAVETPALYAGFALSPDARQLAFSRAGSSGGSDIWIRDLAQSTETRLTFDGAAFTPQWSPDGTRIVFSGPGESPPVKLLVMTVRNAGPAARVGVSKTADFASDWSADGRAIVSVRLDPLNRNDLWIHRLNENADQRLWFDTTFDESHGRVSPDGRWIAFDTDASGQSEVWVASFPSGEVRHQVSVGGGASPEWTGGGKELVYLADHKRVMATRVRATQMTIDLDPPRQLFVVQELAEPDRSAFPTANALIAVSSGERFLVAVRTSTTQAPPISIVVNWRGLLNAPR